MKVVFVGLNRELTKQEDEKYDLSLWFRKDYSFGFLKVKNKLNGEVNQFILRPESSDSYIQIPEDITMQFGPSFTQLEYLGKNDDVYMYKFLKSNFVAIVNIENFLKRYYHAYGYIIRLGEAVCKDYVYVFNGVDDNLSSFFCNGDFCVIHGLTMDKKREKHTFIYCKGELKDVMDEYVFKLVKKLLYNSKNFEEDLWVVKTLIMLYENDWMSKLGRYSLENIIRVKYDISLEEIKKLLEKTEYISLVLAKKSLPVYQLEMALSKISEVEEQIKLNIDLDKVRFYVNDSKVDVFYDGKKILSFRFNGMKTEWSMPEGGWDLYEFCRYRSLSRKLTDKEIIEWAKLFKGFGNKLQGIICYN